MVDKHGNMIDTMQVLYGMLPEGTFRPAILKAGLSDFEKKVFKSLWKRLEESFAHNLYAEGGQFTPYVAQELKAVLQRCLEAYPDNKRVIELTAKKFHETFLKNWQ